MRAGVFSSFKWTLLLVSPRVKTPDQSRPQDRFLSLSPFSVLPGVLSRQRCFSLSLSSPPPQPSVGKKKRRGQSIVLRVPAPSPLNPFHSPFSVRLPSFQIRSKLEKKTLAVSGGFSSARSAVKLGALRTRINPWDR
ncbi:hypothetical protein MLD38_026255 [Melastoma candidum]|uniref:Uncharacterized protein n=1 Tax=Melastoma candidum TaxID=119954 RepID=A0ACB9NYG5_9MYRT|nr:hypothetical protein MLD38_026255 [Melastoma candidum]